MRLVISRRESAGTAWSPAYTALVVNGLEAEAPLEGGRPIKIVRQERVLP